MVRFDSLNFFIICEIVCVLFVTSFVLYHCYITGVVRLENVILIIHLYIMYNVDLFDWMKIYLYSDIKFYYHCQVYLFFG